MLFDDVTHIREAAVADLDCVFVNNVSVAMVLREMLLHKLQKSFPNVSFNTTAERWIEPCDWSVSRAFPFLYAGGWYVRELGCSLAASASS